MKTTDANLPAPNVFGHEQGAAVLQRGLRRNDAAARLADLYQHAPSPAATSPTVAQLQDPKVSHVGTGALERVPRTAVLREFVDPEVLNNAPLQAWAVFDFLPEPHHPNDRQVLLSAAAYLQRLQTLPDTHAPYQPVVDSVTCVLLASKFYGVRAERGPRALWLEAFRRAMALHQQVIGYAMPLPEVNAKFVFAAETRVLQALQWSLKIDDAKLAHAEQTQRHQLHQAASFGHILHLADQFSDDEATFHNILRRCLSGGGNDELGVLPPKHGPAVHFP